MGQSCSQWTARDSRVIPSSIAEGFDKSNLASRSKSSTIPANSEKSEPTFSADCEQELARMMSQAMSSPPSSPAKAASSPPQAYFANPSHYPASNLLRKTIWDGQDLCREHAGVRQAFMQYIYSFAWAEKISEGINDQLVHSRSIASDAHEISFSEYSLKTRSSSMDVRDLEGVANTMMRCTQLKIKDTMESSSYRRKQRVNKLTDSGFSLDSFRYLLLATLWPCFQATEAYSMALTANPSECGQEDDQKDEHEADQLDIPFVDATSTRIRQGTESDRVRHVRSLYESCVHQLPSHDLTMVLQEGQWANEVLKYIEKLPFSLSISSSTPTSTENGSHTSYPIIFVNRAFERLTLYARTEVLGRSHAILQCENTERDQVHKISEALHNHGGVKIAITNRRKNGQDFLNFLAIRSVCTDMTQPQSLVVAVQYDISKTEAAFKDLKMINDLLAVMCNIFKA